MVVLAVAESGNDLAPMIMFKRKHELKLKNTMEWIVAIQQKDWMDEHLIIRLVKEIHQYTEKKQSLCVLDSFCAHIIETMKKKLD